ncbi:MAG: CopG family transcriptional regulator [Gallionellales bacterium CG_4_8_14_3_um_filter_54_18]|nr:MAG: CopG family transcriptional regulator [Gallionellales bacterium CG_4_8_14_3_um_filter_54_18]PJC04487.1 MAG: CopG family transcriptional regulator [Gallionellales bacterium CG_4_9_14_0_8_um_filter_55_61]
MKMLERLLLTLMLALFCAGTALAATAVTVYKSPTCGCCEKYVDYLRENGFEVKTVDEQDMSAIKKRYGMDHIASCHTALVGGYVVEGHVPVAAIRKLLKEKPDLIGISAPGMPMNSPGMGEMKQGTLTIYAVPKNGREPYVFSVE